MRGMHQLDDRVFVKDAKFAWLPATVVQCTHDEVLVNLALPSDWRATTKGSKREMPKERWVKLDDYKDRALPFQNTGKASRDMADLPHLHEAAILYQIKERHTMQRPYTRVGEIVVAVNPCSWIKDLYSADQGVLYAKNFVWHSKSRLAMISNPRSYDGRLIDDSLISLHQIVEDAPETPGDLREEKKEESPIGSTSFGSIYNKLGVEPHVYEVSALAYRGMFLERKNQTILVSGESGAGKTETVKIILNHLATLETSSLSVGDVSGNDMIQHIVESSPVFEAFGNAQTVRNHNSSRFGKMTRLHFGFRSNGMCGLRGSTCRTYLLETNRVVSQAPGERNFHIFYQLLAASPEAKVELLGNSWEHTDAKDFLYLNGTKTAAKDAEMWEQTRSALEFFDWKGDKLHGLCQALAVVLRLGNIIFDQDPESDGCHTSYAQVELAAEALGLSANTLDHALRHRVLQMGGDRVDVKLTPSNAKNALDTLVRKIYEIVFQSILRSVNEQTKEKNFEETDGIISLLDIYGFEAFEVNRFEQLCINYANEMLHKKYIDDNFKRVKDEYEEEGIELFDFSTVDNADVLELLQGRQGIISMVNEECVIPNGSSLVRTSS
jgi:myosin heavy subunit